MRLTLRTDVSAAHCDDGTILLDEATGRYWQLNGTASAILSALLDGASPQQVADGLRARHPALAAERAAEDVTSLVASLTRAGLVDRA
ncbi:lasso peptide biosynthesis PqqD family chaperone [Streptomyces sp. NPDC050504]|uniref:lasso peptide biosynthesis PqqD family chaperone n=1 Tax=Streptomyces sp. NPDC050504 TaxID=3365618 RepID=UPI0037B33258